MEADYRITVGVISDTHGLLRNNVFQVFKNADYILHAGDVGSQAILNELKKLAPITVVRGNMDTGDWAAGLALTDMVKIGNHYLYLLHDLSSLDIDPLAAGVDIIISGHTHQPLINKQNKILYLNPGSAGPRRMNLPVSVAMLYISRNRLDAEIIDLEI